MNIYLRQIDDQQLQDKHYSYFILHLWDWLFTEGSSGLEIFGHTTRDKSVNESTEW